MFFRRNVQEKHPKFVVYNLRMEKRNKPEHQQEQ
jgi:hypothetical protein